MFGKKTTLLLLSGALALPGLAAAAGTSTALPVSAIQRRALTAHVAEYSFTVRVGSGPLLGSTDVTTHIVHKVPAAQRIVDYGHADLFLAGDAQTQVWQPILNWVQAH